MIITDPRALKLRKWLLERTGLAGLSLYPFEIINKINEIFAEPEVPPCNCPICVDAGKAMPPKGTTK